MSELWESLKKTWQVDGYWEPLAQVSLEQEVLVMDANAYEAAVAPAALQEKLRVMGVNRVFELREHEAEPSHLLAVELFDPYYSLAEGFWFTSDLDWLLYASHEGSVTAGGTKIISAIEEIWPDCRKHPWSLG
jgi:hypothetical protein